jgi:hypothetical protein
MKETKYCRTATKSRHFAVQTPPAKTSSSITSATSSKHFLHSPSSAIGSVRSMPNFLTTLLPPHMEEMPPEESGCSCKSLAEAARSQFQHCPIFQETRRSYLQSRRNAQQKSGVSCCDEQILELQASLRHLCPHGCYLRAFAPLREWHSLRAIVAERSETSSPGIITASLVTLVCKPRYSHAHYSSLFCRRCHFGRMEVQLGRSSERRWG